MINKPTTAPPKTSLPTTAPSTPPPKTAPSTTPSPPPLAALPHSPLSLQPPRPMVLSPILSIAFSDSLPNQKLPLNEPDEVSLSEI